MSRFPTPNKNTRIGFHYFPDTDHFRAINLRTWLPELQALGTSWITLHAPNDRAIPETFLKGLLEQDIAPILLFDMPLDNPPSLRDISILFSTYARWGVNYIRLFDRPNSRASWSSTSWAQTNLVERFLDIYLPYALSALQAGLVPIFPPLKPGAGYWDTAFLRASLEAIKRRGHQKLLDYLIVGAHATMGHRSITWGKGGPERWPQTKPYTASPTGAEDQRGFYIFDWYIPIIEAVTHKPASIILFEAGVPLKSKESGKVSILNINDHTMRNLSLIKAFTASSRIVTNQSEYNDSIIDLDPVPDQVIACNFWLLADCPNSPHITNAWYKPDGSTLPVVKTTSKFMSERSITKEFQDIETKTPSDNSNNSIAHYLLLPTYEWGVTDWHLDLIKPFVKQHQPTIGFSLKEASKATRVSVVGGVQAFSQEDLDFLKAAGCVIDRISRDGTSIATED